MKYIKLVPFILFIGFIAACGKPELPVAITFRDAILQKSMVAQIHNNSKETLKIRITATGKDGVSKTSDEIILPPGDPLEVGWLEGWSFLPGEKIAINSAGFAEYRITIP